MATLTISAQLESILDGAAREAGSTPEELAEAILSAHLAVAELPLTADQIAHIGRSIEQLDRGEYIDSEEVERFLDEWQAELDAR